LPGERTGVATRAVARSGVSPAPSPPLRRRSSPRRSRFWLRRRRLLPTTDRGQVPTPCRRRVPDITDRLPRRRTMRRHRLRPITLRPRLPPITRRPRLPPITRRPRLPPITHRGRPPCTTLRLWRRGTMRRARPITHRVRPTMRPEPATLRPVITTPARRTVAARVRV